MTETIVTTKGRKSPDPMDCATKVYNRWIDLIAEVMEENKDRIPGLEKEAPPIKAKPADLLRVTERMVAEAYTDRSPDDPWGGVAIEGWQAEARRVLLDRLVALARNTKDADLLLELGKLDPSLAPPPPLAGEQIQALRALQDELAVAEERLLTTVKEVLLAIEKVVRGEAETLRGTSSVGSHRLLLRAQRVVAQTGRALEIWRGAPWGGLGSSEAALREAEQYRRGGWR